MLLFFVCICVFFDCKCKSLKRLGEYIKKNRKKHKQTQNNSKKNRNNKNINTVFPAHELPRNINISKGLAGRFLFLFYVFLRVFLFCLLFICVFVDCKCKSLKILGENINKTEINTNTTDKLEETHNKQTEEQDIQPRNLRE